ncbi:protein NRT1/ PTR FAMILY 5.5-like [Salvia splendens]|uniref:protein NRT1/ PTR FAMILY 5.5-like n=1 Tax=Salvia splendens TaxID=180675 RepID=UPI001C262839|nr:protein NRT1/ PTR FAMILY 5.5-like [Salvia splendens]XP_042045851.1 protein NRT1/ PTR FAMILY 5.5-like [Salvia splendens]XP_042045852.1 protein NRT1/ PTR FAMILY 5.5-like [Salvia splendens]XP_042045853.1 protein NRT1/ PTR FAMILY 5.5-like [Salvia splendens]XP_042045854.1 protein NRT1/ PTR FAMILY 5.5-like [Salvia splendens]XP_042045855.1 protein NRT1/ PTR FAMILY 5.5-like [Salvia splendens]XP_042045856.1 protein NRT1/ PTR FAMILY 5.5-like [Salvia splendens]XP_042045857.1 protein NRT1/ PTR FAMILY
MKSAVRISALLWADILVLYALFEMQDYLTEVWGLSFTHAAGILNVWNGISLVLQPLFLFAVSTFLGNFYMLVISSSSYTLGIWLLFMSAPPVLANATGTCKQYEQECISKTHKALLYTGMALIAVGVAGNNVSVLSYLREQPDNKSRGAVIGCLKIPGMAMVAIVGLAGAIALPYIKPWTYRFGIPAVCTTIAGIAFLTGLCFCTFDFPDPNRKRIENLGRMFSLRMLPMWLTFLVCGIISSTGNTYFVEQAKNLDRHLGSWEVPTQVLLLAQTYLGMLLAYLVYVFLNGHGVVKAKILGVLCCIAAAGVERKRLGVVRSKGLLDKQEDDVPMSVYWLLFQFVLLGGMDKLLEKSVAEFDEEGIAAREGNEPDPNELKRLCMEIFSKGVCGLGFMCGVLLVYVAGKISAKGDEPNWFQFSLNRSHLDRYYWVLAVLSSLSLFLYVVVRQCCCCLGR